MTNISTRRVDDGDYKAAYAQLVKTVSKLRSSNASSFFEGLLTKSEMIMIVKRFACAIMFQKGYSPYKVSTALGVSISTAQRLHDQYEQGAFNAVLQCVTKKEKSEFISILEDFLLSRSDFKARKRLLNRALK